MGGFGMGVWKGLGNLEIGWMSFSYIYFFLK